jgi:hypothetical protein
MTTRKAHHALDLACDDVRRAAHDRHRVLYGASVSAGMRVGSGALEYEEAGDALFQAATANGYVAKIGAARAIRIIKDGLRSGEAKVTERPRATVA